MEVEIPAADCQILEVYVEPGTKSEEDYRVEVFAFSFPETQHSRLNGS